MILMITGLTLSLAITSDQDDQIDKDDVDKEEIGGFDEILETSVSLLDDVENIDTKSDAAEGQREFALTEEKLDNFPSPLVDWTQDLEVFHLTSQNEDPIHIDVSGDVKGELLVLDADFYELSGNEDGSVTTVHFGQNIYFIPEGHEFPSDYEWSEEGATLLNISTSVSNNADFGEIKLIARVETGSNEVGFTNDTSGLVDASITSNLVVSYA